jgi:hypothetical protein
MFERDYLRKVRRELHARGIWGDSARRLTEQLSDHFHETVATLTAEGREASVAQEEALEILGSPGAVAKAAAEGLREQSALARHPWWMGGVAFFMIFAATLLILFLGFRLSGFPVYLVTGNVRDLSFTTLSVFAFLANWMPFLMSIALLGWTAWKKPVGWKPLFIVCAAIGFAAGGLTTCLLLPAHGPGSGSFSVCGESWLSTFILPICRGHYAGLLGMLLHSDPIPFLKLLLPCVICVGLRQTLQRLNGERTREA